MSKNPSSSTASPATPAASRGVPARVPHALHRRRPRRQAHQGSARQDSWIENAEYEIAEVAHTTEALTKLFKGRESRLQQVGPS